MGVGAVDSPETMQAASTPWVVQLRGVGKAYKIFASKMDNLADALGLDHVLPWFRPRHQEFWALRGIDLELGKGQRIGIVGRNGAGKTTMLKLITRNLSPTTGTVSVRGRVQALMGTGAGFHPDFTGRDNIRAALTLQGFSTREISDSIDDIADFTELGAFLDRPFKTYSSGMMARLMFATATAIKPEILIIDEILGAGDAYFLGKSNERMRQLVDSGASILLVSHSMEQITLICEEAIWLDRGRVVKRGTSLDVVSAYSQYLRILEDRRKKARNQKVASGRRLASDLMDSYSETTLIHFVVAPGANLEVTRVRLLRDGTVEEECRIGDAQDSEASAAAFVVLAGGSWERPESSDGTLYRAIRAAKGGEAVGQVAINLFALYPKVAYKLQLEYRLRAGSAAFEVWVTGRQLNRFPLGPTGREFEIATFDLPDMALAEPAVSSASDGQAQRAAPADPVQTEAPRSETSSVQTAKTQTRWPGESSLLIDGVQFLGDDGREHAVFEHGDKMCMRMKVRALKTGSYPVIPVAVLYRSDGVKVFSQVGESGILEVGEGDERIYQLDLGPLNLGDGQYAFAVAIYKKLEASGESIWYDLIDRDYRFQVIGAPRFMGLVDHAGRWTIS